jgi:hypothetical protein
MKHYCARVLVGSFLEKISGEILPENWRNFTENLLLFFGKNFPEKIA